MSELSALVRGTDILIISDEVYEHIIFDGAQHESMARYPELAERSFIIGSFGKTYHITGWKVGLRGGAGGADRPSSARSTSSSRSRPTRRCSTRSPK